eukprot:6179278-Pleurochrysis_carterae.AAC.2
MRKRSACVEDRNVRAVTRGWKTGRGGQHGHVEKTLTAEIGYEWARNTWIWGAARIRGDLRLWRGSARFGHLGSRVAQWPGRGGTGVLACHRGLPLPLVVAERPVPTYPRCTRLAPESVVVKCRAGATACVARDGLAVNQVEGMHSALVSVDRFSWACSTLFSMNPRTCTSAKKTVYSAKLLKKARFHFSMLLPMSSQARSYACELCCHMLIANAIADTGLLPRL